ncbi:hypothetical protein ACFL6K_02810 [Candidatus Latescibacterota bacterium]
MKLFILLISIMVCSAPLNSQEPFQNIPIDDINKEESLFQLLVNAPWADTSKLSSDYVSDWETESYSEGDISRQNLIDHGYTLRAFLQKDDKRILKLHTYAIPSLSDVTELILMGTLQVNADTDDDASQIHSRMVSLFRDKGFIVEPAPEGSYRGKFYHEWTDVLKIESENIKGNIYIHRHRENLSVKAIIRHSKFDEFDYKEARDWDNWWKVTSALKMPDKLIYDFESQNITSIIDPDVWDKIKDLSQSSEGSSVPEEKMIPLETLKKVIDAVESSTPEESNLPTHLLLKDYLYKYFFYGNQFSSDFEQYLNWLEENGVQLRYSEIGGSHNYFQNNLITLADTYPDTYWGQFAFLKLLIMGFDTSGTCRNGREKWPVVIQRGTEFIEKYPESEFVPEILFFLGKAEETLYSVSLTKNDNYVNYKAHQDETAQSRKNALKYYEKFLKTDKAHLYDEHLKYIMPRLRLGVSTGSRFYHCFHD